MINLDRIPDTLGHLVLSGDGAILSSGGELENNEHIANVVYSLISLTDKLGPHDDKYKKLSITFKECSYVVCLSNNKVYIIKKKFQSPTVEENNTDDEMFEAYRTVNSEEETTEEQNEQST